MNHCNEPVRLKCLGCGTGFSQEEWSNNGQRCLICDQTAVEVCCVTCGLVTELTGPGVYRPCASISEPEHTLAVSPEPIADFHGHDSDDAIETFLDVFYRFDAANPFNIAIREHKDFSRIRSYLFSSQFISGVFLLLLHLLTILLSIVLWPLGLLYSCGILLGRKSAGTVRLLKTSTAAAEYMAHGFSLLLVYFPLLLVLLVISAPVFGINWLARTVSRDPELIGATFGYIVLGLVALCAVAAIIGIVIGLVIYVLLPLALIALIISFFNRD